jgi:hypothetical protein
VTTTPLTIAESSGWQETSRHADVLAFLAALEERRDPRLHRTSFGVSPEGRELPLLVLSRDGVRTPAEARRTDRPVILIICGIHAGEVEGKEAMLILLRELLGGAHEEILENATLLVVPLYNPDGNDRIDPRNRVLDVARFQGQSGPAGGVGTRVNAAGINLNRDYLRQDAAESRLLASRVVIPWAPDLTIDCHSTNGSVHRFSLTYDTPHTVASGRHEPIAYMRERFLPEVRRAVRAASGRELFFYGNFVEDEGGQGEGWMTYTHHPRFGSNYRGLTGRCDLLLECYSYLEYEERVRTTHEVLLAALRRANQDAAELRRVVAASAAPPARIAVRYRLEAEPEPATILTRAPRALDGAPISVTVPHLARWVGVDPLARPWGYAVPPAIGERLARHGLAVRTLDAARDARVEVARVSKVAPTDSRNILEAAGELVISAEPSAATRRLAAGTCVVETEQPLGAIAVYLCEAQSDDGLVACGFIPAPAPGDEHPALRLVDPV